jgi:hypothetical protein
VSITARSSGAYAGSGASHAPLHIDALALLDIVVNDAEKTVTLSPFSEPPSRTEQGQTGSSAGPRR